MNVDAASLPGVLVLTPRVFADSRGFFLETFHAERYQAHHMGPFVQDNWSRSVKHTLRGLHFQEPNAQGKLVGVLRGSVFDVTVDIRRGSPHFGRWFGTELSDSNRKQLWVPPGFAHAFCVLSDEADFVYKCTTYYDPASEQSIRWTDPQLKIEWPTANPILSKRDHDAPLLAHARLPTYL